MYKFKTYLAVDVKYLENSHALLYVYSGCHETLKITAYRMWYFLVWQVGTVLD